VVEKNHGRPVAVYLRMLFVYALSRVRAYSLKDNVIFAYGFYTTVVWRYSKRTDFILVPLKILLGNLTIALLTKKQTSDVQTLPEARCGLYLTINLTAVKSTTVVLVPNTLKSGSRVLYFGITAEKYKQCDHPKKYLSPTVSTRINAPPISLI